MLNWIVNPRLDMRSKLRIAYDLLYVMIVYRVREPAFLAVACGAMFRLNRYAWQQASKRNAHPIYYLKNRFIRMLYEFGYCQSVTQQKQILECWTCQGTGEVYDPWEASVYDCWKCGGTGIYRTVILYRFTFNVRGTRWIWHQPQDLVGWPVDITDEDPEPYQRLGDVESRTKREIGRAIAIVWAALRFTRSPQSTLPGLPEPDERYHHIPFPTGWFENQVPLTPWEQRHWIKQHIEQIKMCLLKRFWPAKFDELYAIPF